MFSPEFPWRFGDVRLADAFPDAHSRMCACGTAIVQTFAIAEERNNAAPPDAAADVDASAGPGAGYEDDCEAGGIELDDRAPPAERFTDLFEELGPIGAVLLLQDGACSDVEEDFEASRIKYAACVSIHSELVNSDAKF